MASFFFSIPTMASDLAEAVRLWKVIYNVEQGAYILHRLTDDEIAKDIKNLRSSTQQSLISDAELQNCVVAGELLLSIYYKAQAENNADNRRIASTDRDKYLIPRNICISAQGVKPENYDLFWKVTDE